MNQFHISLNAQAISHGIKKQTESFCTVPNAIPSFSVRHFYGFQLFSTPLTFPFQLRSNMSSESKAEPHQKKLRTAS
jgi:hypothetical protein